MHCSFWDIFNFYAQGVLGSTALSKMALMINEPISIPQQLGEGGLGLRFCRVSGFTTDCRMQPHYHKMPVGIALEHACKTRAHVNCYICYV